MNEITQMRTQVRRRILEDNDQEAARLRRSFTGAGTLVLNLVSSPGSGKTTLLEKTLAGLAGGLRAAVLVGDVATERDAERIRARGVPAQQIVTGGACHLDARLVSQGLREAAFGALDLLFIENVGNLVCPASYDLGEDFKVAVLSVAEGDDKPFKYPAIFSKAELVLISKADLLPYLDFDLESVQRQIRSLNPGAEILVLSARTGAGMNAWCRLLEERSAAKRQVPA